jgi:hypothetical protein
MYVRLELEISTLNYYEGPHYAVSCRIGFLPLSLSLSIPKIVSVELKTLSFFPNLLVGWQYSPDH